MQRFYCRNPDHAKRIKYRHMNIYIQSACTTTLEIGDFKTDKISKAG